MSNHPDESTDHPTREVRAVKAALIELGHLLEDYKDFYAIIGGAVPWLLLDGAVPQHIGTLDIDLGLDPNGFTDGKYADLVITLKAVGYEHTPAAHKPFQLAKEVTIDGHPTIVILDLLKPSKEKTQKNKPKLIEDFRIQDIPGCRIALGNFVEHTLDGVMPYGRNNCVSINVASIPALLVMKGFALKSRMKDKDAYDIYYCVRHFPAGVTKLAEECAELLASDSAKEAFRNIASKFRKIEDYGSQTVKRMLENTAAVFQDMTGDQVQTDAYYQVKNLIDEIEKISPFKKRYEEKHKS